MDFTKVRWAVREAIFNQHNSLPVIGSEVDEYEIASVEIIKALNDSGYLVVPKPRV